jgi:hypothetical protein
MPIHMDAQAGYRPRVTTVKAVPGGLCQQRPSAGPFRVVAVPEAEEPDKTADGANSGARSDTLAACATRVRGRPIALLADRRDRPAGMGRHPAGRPAPARSRLPAARRSSSPGIPVISLPRASRAAMPPPVPVAAGTGRPRAWRARARSGASRPPQASRRPFILPASSPRGTDRPGRQLTATRIRARRPSDGPHPATRRHRPPVARGRGIQNLDMPGWQLASWAQASQATPSRLIQSLPSAIPLPTSPRPSPGKPSTPRSQRAAGQRGGLRCRSLR